MALQKRYIVAGILCCVLLFTVYTKPLSPPAVVATGADVLSVEQLRDPQSLLAAPSPSKQPSPGEQATLVPAQTTLAVTFGATSPHPVSSLAPAPAHGEKKQPPSTSAIPQPLKKCEGSTESCICPQSRGPTPSQGHRLAVIVPFRDGCAVGSQGGGRSKNLAEFVPYMHEFLKKSGKDFRIILVDQVKRGLFNKGFLFNAGYLIANRSYDHIALHDVDLVPENPENTYAYPEGLPVHMCIANSRTNYEPAYRGMVGGVLMMKTEHYAAINGFANTYWTWGQEDDDMFNRIVGVLGNVESLSPSIGRYRALDHDRVMGLDETQRFRDQRKELYAAIAAAAAGKLAATAHVMKNGWRQVRWAITEYGCRDDYEHYVVDYLNPDQPMDPC